jgi:YHS domain-containing protein
VSRDPVCGREVDPLRARGVGIWGGCTFYFCSMEHREAFARDPGAYAQGPRAASPAVPVPVTGGRSGRAERADRTGRTSDRVEAVPEKIDRTERTPSPPVADRITPEPAPRAETPIPGALYSLTPPTGIAAGDAPVEVPREISKEQSVPLRPPVNRVPIVLVIVAVIAAIVVVAWLAANR